MTPLLRVFISSPGDVRPAREIVAQAVERVAQDYLRFFSVTPYLWENEALQATGHFQDFIEEPAEFDIVILLLGSRLGTPLPEQTAVRAYRGLDGRAPVTGTEWEFENAWAASRSKGTPALLIYRSVLPVQIDAWDAGRRQVQLEQLALLDAFWSRHFASPGDGTGAYHQFAQLEELAAAVDGHLRKLLDRRVTMLHAAPTGQKIWARAPYRGLESYEFEHAPVFYGRNAVTGQAMLALIDNAAKGCSFLLLLAASGSGKSSIAKAGVAPRMFVPRRVPGRKFVARAVFRPADRAEGEDIFAALARCLSVAEGCRVLSPTLGPAALLAERWRSAPERADLDIGACLRALRPRDGQADGESCQLFLIVDQLEEIYAASVSETEREGFALLLRAFARSGCIWVLATMRSDFWHRVGETPILMALAEGAGRVDVTRPSAAEIGEMISRPAAAAGLEFERDPQSDVPLNALIAQEAAGHPAALPLLSYLMEQLYLRDADSGRLLTCSTYRALGGLHGSIAQRAEDVLAVQPEAVQATLPQVIFELVQVSAAAAGNSVMARRCPRDRFEQSAAVLVTALLDARLLTSEGETGQEPTVRVAHEALLTEWARARQIVRESAHFLRIRRRVEECMERFAQPAAAEQREASKGLLSGFDLQDALRLEATFGTALPAQLKDYIARSARRDKAVRQRGLALAISIAAIMTVLFIAAAALFFTVRKEQAAMRSVTEAAHGAFLTFEQVGVHLLSDIREYNYASEQFRANSAVGEELTKVYRDDLQLQYNLANNLALEAAALSARGRTQDLVDAQKSYRRALAVTAGMAAKDAGDARLRSDRIALENFIRKRLH